MVIKLKNRYINVNNNYIINLLSITVKKCALFGKSVQVIP